MYQVIVLSGKFFLSQYKYILGYQRPILTIGKHLFLPLFLTDAFQRIVQSILSRWYSSLSILIVQNQILFD